MIEEDEFDRHDHTKGFNKNNRAKWEQKRMHERYCVNNDCGYIYTDYKAGACPECGAWTNAS